VTCLLFCPPAAGGRVLHAHTHLLIHHRAAARARRLLAPHIYFGDGVIGQSVTIKFISLSPQRLKIAVIAVWIRSKTSIVLTKVLIQTTPINIKRNNYC
jgi:hypothetical protein